MILHTATFTFAPGPDPVNSRYTMWSAVTDTAGVLVRANIRQGNEFFIESGHTWEVQIGSHTTLSGHVDADADVAAEAAEDAISDYLAEYTAMVMDQ